eukprot:scaffold29_cov251-Pinguiococcus_pyrenoidosus.AAC.36
MRKSRWTDGAERAACLARCESTSIAPERSVGLELALRSCSAPEAKLAGVSAEKRAQSSFRIGLQICFCGSGWSIRFSQRIHSRFSKDADRRALRRPVVPCSVLEPLRLLTFLRNPCLAAEALRRSTGRSKAGSTSGRFPRPEQHGSEQAESSALVR